MVADPGLSSKPLDEESIIKILWGRFGTKNKSDPFNDDAAWTANSRKKKFVVVKADMMVATTDAPKQMTPEQIGRKSVVACISDLAAKGVQPSFCLLSVGLPRQLANRKYVSGLARGFALSESEYDLEIIGGDTNATLVDPVIDCSILGFADSVVKRRGANPGDIVGVSGPFGHQAAGLLILLGKAKSHDRSFMRKATDSVLNPKAKLEVGLKAARYLTSCIDSSDGLAISLYHLAESNGNDMALFEIPIQDGVRDFARENNLGENDLALFGGEEYELVCTYDPKHERILSKMGIVSIGRVVSRSRRRAGVSINGKMIPRKGWLHFQS